MNKEGTPQLYFERIEHLITASPLFTPARDSGMIGAVQEVLQQIDYLRCAYEASPFPMKRVVANLKKATEELFDAVKTAEQEHQPNVQLPQAPTYTHSNSTPHTQPLILNRNKNNNNGKAMRSMLR